MAMNNLIKKIKIAFGIGALVALGACTTVSPITLGTVTPTHVYAHVIKIHGTPEPRISGFRCQTRPLFFRQDATNLVQKGVLNALSDVVETKAPIIGGGDIQGVITTENRVLWTRQCVNFSVTPLVMSSKPNQKGG